MDGRCEYVGSERLSNLLSLAPTKEISRGLIGLLPPSPRMPPPGEAPKQDPSHTQKKNTPALMTGLNEDNGIEC